MTLQSRGSADVAELGPWFHNLHLPDGTRTAPDHPLGDFPAFKWAELGPALPEDMTGCRALEVGCNAGFYTFELAKRGADVLAIDHDEHYLRQARWACERFGLEERIELRHLGVYELAAVRETYDLVLFMGVLYHLRYPLLALDLVAERAAGTLVVQTLTTDDGAEPVDAPEALAYGDRRRLTEPGWPAMAFVEHAYAGDPTNWWVPNAACVEAMLRTSGMRVVARPGHEMWVCERGAASAHEAELRLATGRGG